MNVRYKSELMFKGKIFDVWREVTHEGTFDVVRRNPVVVILTLPRPDTVILVGQYRHAAGKPLWEVPAGGIEPGENILTAAKRECHEEIGLIPAGLTYVGGLFPSPGYTDEVMHFMIGQNLAPGERAAAKDPDERIEIGYFGLEKAQAMVRNGEITDLKTAYALSLVPNERADGARPGARGANENYRVADRPISPTSTLAVSVLRRRRAPCGRGQRPAGLAVYHRALSDLWGKGCGHRRERLSR